MSADVQQTEAESEVIYLLRDYATQRKYWRVRAKGGYVLGIQLDDRRPDEFVNGMLEKREINGRPFTLGFLSAARLESLPGAPNYSKNLMILVNDRLLGDDLAEPRLRFEKGIVSRDLSVKMATEWRFHIHYPAPWLREIIRRLNFSGTIDYDPVDFTERLVEIIETNRPQWL